MRATNPAVKLTYDDFVRFPDDGQRHELIEGEHVVTPSPSARHQRIAGTLHALIWNYLEVSPIGEVFIAPFDVVLSQFSVVEPDVLYLSNERRATALTELHVRGVPDLVIEVVSKSTRRRDDTVKRALYERMGVTEYWVVDPRVSLVRVYQHDGTHFTSPIVLSRASGDVLRTALLPGLDLPLERLFRER